MANPKHLAVLKKGVAAWNRWRKKYPTVEPDLRGVRFIEADLRGADLSKALLRFSDLSRTDLSGANLSKACLNETDLSAAKLTSADLSGAELYRANLIGAHLDGADLTGAETMLTTFANVDLSGVKGLETIKHWAPSSIGVETIYKSKGKIPHVFLRGAGVPENFIESMAELVGTEKEFYSLFISYSAHNEKFVEKLYRDLQGEGVRCYYAPHDLLPGRKVHDQVKRAIRERDKVLLILSVHSMASEWVRTEIAEARKREADEKREILFPISLCPFEAIRKWQYFDSDIGKDSAREIREYFIPDFSNWSDPDAYRKAFDRLLKALHGKSDRSSA